jgi:hypothetical protein
MDITVQAVRLITTGALCALVLLLPRAPASAQTPDEAGKRVPEREFHPNHFGGTVALSARSDIDEVAPTLGLEYTRQFSAHWGVTGYMELISGLTERDIILAAGGVYYPVRGLGLVLALGAEGAEKELIESDEIERENELAFLVRIGAAYGFPLTETAALGPTFQVDRASGRTTFVLGLTMVVGF